MGAHKANLEPRAAVRKGRAPVPRALRAPLERRSLALFDIDLQSLRNRLRIDALAILRTAPDRGACRSAAPGSYTSSLIGERRRLHRRPYEQDRGRQEQSEYEALLQGKLER